MLKDVENECATLPDGGLISHRWSRMRRLHACTLIFFYFFYGGAVNNLENRSPALENTPPSLQAIYQRYYDFYHGNKVTITTNYAPYSEFDIFFNEDQLPHLLGLHKVDQDSASNQIIRIKNNELTYQSIKKHDSFKNIRDRIKYFDFIDKVFITNEVKDCICVSKDDSRNSMSLDIVFLEHDIKRVLNLGLRKDKAGLYAPVTFFVSSSKNKSYPHSKRAKIKSLIWDDKLVLFEKSIHAEAGVK